jgi:hypothetical protein
MIIDVFYSAYHHNIEVRRELLEVNGGNIYQTFENETGVKLKIGDLQKLDNYHDLDLPRLENMCDDIIINSIQNQISRKYVRETRFFPISGS